MLPDQRTDECVRRYVSVVLAEIEKQIPPLRHRVRSGSGRNDRAFFAPEPALSFHSFVHVVIYIFIYSVLTEGMSWYGEELV